MHMVLTFLEVAAGVREMAGWQYVLLVVLEG